MDRGVRVGVEVQRVRWRRMEEGVEGRGAWRRRVASGVGQRAANMLLGSKGRGEGQVRFESEVKGEVESLARRKRIVDVGIASKRRSTGEETFCKKKHRLDLSYPAESRLLKRYIYAAPLPCNRANEREDLEEWPHQALSSLLISSRELLCTLLERAAAASPALEHLPPTRSALSPALTHLVELLLGELSC